MIDFFRKSGSMTKRVSGIAKIQGMPEVKPRSLLKLSRIGTFKDGEESAASIFLYVADDEESRRKGLMGVDISPVCGMLFDGLSGGGYFWMKDCIVALDVAFMDKEGTIKSIYTMPVDKEGKQRYEYGDDIVSAVEAKAGFFDDNGISIGFKLATRPLEGSEEGNG